MPRPLHKLSSRTVATVGPGRYSDGGGLYLRVTESGARRWVFRHSDPLTQSVREMGLGSAGPGGVPLASARRLASEARDTLQARSSPIGKKHASRGAELTFGEFADEFVASQSAGFRNRKHIDQWQMTLTTYAERLRPISIATIGTEDVLAVLGPIWQTKSETASRVRGRIERVLDAAKARGFRTGESPARWRGHLSLLLPKRLKLTRGHHKALPYSALPDFLAALRERSGPAARALEFLVLTASRSGEVRLMTWREVDLQSMIWIVPAERMKAGREHRVPLTDHLVELIKSGGGDRYNGDLVFPGPIARNSLTDAALTNLLKRMKVDATVHGFRSSFRDWAGDMTDYAREVAEAALAHVVGDATERAYRRGDAFEKRQLLMQTWEHYCLGGQERGDNGERNGR